MTNPTHCLLIELEIPEDNTELYLEALASPRFKAEIRRLLMFPGDPIKVGVIEVIEEPELCPDCLGSGYTGAYAGPNTEEPCGCR